MTRGLINLKTDVDFTKQPLFFGEPLNIERYDKFRYHNIYKMAEQQIESFWRPNEIDTTNDRKDFKKLLDYQKEIFTNNLKYQILLDSVQSRGIPHLVQHLSNPETEAFCSWWAAFETLHSQSYTHIIKEVYSKPSEVLDHVMDNEEIIKRTVSVTKYYDDLIDSFGDSEIELRKKLLLTLVSINILEGIRFYVSFACSWAFGEDNKMEGNAKIISLIARDENLHLGFTQFVLRQLKNNEEEGFTEIWKELEPTIIKMYEDAANEEMQWAKYLFRNGSLMGLNAEILTEFMKYLTNSRMKAIEIKPIFEKTRNPIPWINNWLDNKRQPAPQETEITSYNVGAIKSDLNDSDFSSFSF